MRRACTVGCAPFLCMKKLPEWLENMLWYIWENECGRVDNTTVYLEENGGKQAIRIPDCDFSYSFEGEGIFVGTVLIETVRRLRVL